MLDYSSMAHLHMSEVLRECAAVTDTLPQICMFHLILLVSYCDAFTQQCTAVAVISNKDIPFSGMSQ
jgi:hypothetical protein